MRKSAIFIDGGYLNKVIKGFFKKVELDYLKFSEIICKVSKTERIRTYYYHCKPFVRSDKNEKKDQRRLRKCEKFFRKLKRLSRFEVREGDLQFLGYN